VNKLIESWLQQYPQRTTQDTLRALHEIFQEIALLGLWRAKFYEHAAFYGGTALRVLHGLDRFSEDLDFSLLRIKENFDLSSYNEAIRSELESFGFEVEVKAKEKTTAIQSAFIKANTRQQLIAIGTSHQAFSMLPKDQLITIKMEIDTFPPGNFQTESRYLLKPIPFSVLSFDLPSLFAGKLHALLCRQWKTRVKGRDWYDFLWYVGRNVKPNLLHLQTRLIQSGHFPETETLTLEKLKQKLLERIDQIDWKAAKVDVAPFVLNSSAIEAWSASLFRQAVERLRQT